MNLKNKKSLPDVQLLSDSGDGVLVVGGQDARVGLVPPCRDVPDT
jgi:hypothetical protein